MQGRYTCDMSPDDRPVPPIRFASVHGARLAYQDFGSGSETIVAIPPFAQNIETAWEWPEIRAMFDRFGSFARYVHFDKRGTGASDRDGRIDNIDERVDDLRAIMDAAGIERAHVFGLSEGGPIAVMFAVTYPDRVDSLILFGTGATLAPPDLTDEDRKAIRDRFDITASQWGTPESPIPDRMAPSLAAIPEFREWHQRYERSSAERASIREFLELSLGLDVRDVLTDVRVPTLVIHRTDDRAIPVERGRSLAAGIDGAEYIEIPGEDHFGFAGDMESWMGPLEKFVTGSVTVHQPHEPMVVKPRIRTLGRFAVEVAGREVPAWVWVSRRARQLCKRLVAQRGWPITRDQLIDMLWPDEVDMTTLSARLSVQLSKVRRVLGGGVIADRQSVRLNLDEVATDLDDFYRADDHHAIVAAYGGPFLPDDLYDDWTIGPRDEARVRFVTAARQVGTDAMAAGDYRLAGEMARRLVEAYPFDDAAHRLLVRSLAAAGEHRESERAHAAWVTAMAEIDVAVPAFDSVVD